MPILIKDLFAKDPLQWRLLNEGVSSNNATDASTLRYELETFVCEGGIPGWNGAHYARLPRLPRSGAEGGG